MSDQGECKKLSLLLFIVLFNHDLITTYDFSCVFEKNIIIRLRLSYPDKFETRANWPARSQIYYMVHRFQIFRNLQSKSSFDSGGSSLPRVQLT